MSNSELYQIEKDAFLAGLFDADGSVSIYQSLKKKSNKVYTVHACEISMTNEEVINWIKDTVGFGNIFYREAHEKWLGTKPQWRWKVSHKKALEFAKIILPYSIIKKDKLNKIIKHYEIKKEVV
jgi:hypothetical protein